MTIDEAIERRDMEDNEIQFLIGQVEDANKETPADIPEELVKAGMMTVVEWLRGSEGINGIWYQFRVGDFNTQLKVWFKDNPELLKEWGLE